MIKVIRNKKSLVKFSSLKPGDVFSYPQIGEKLFLRIRNAKTESGSLFNAISLERPVGEHFTFGLTTDDEVINHDITIMVD